MSPLPDHRLRLLGGIMAVLVLYLMGGLAWRQLVLGGQYAEEEQRQNQRAILLPGPRGSIFDRHGRLLAGNRARFNAVVYLNELRGEFREEYTRLARAERAASRPLNRVALQRQARLNVLHGYLRQVEELTGLRGEVDPAALDRHFRQNLLLPFPLYVDLPQAAWARLVEQLPATGAIQLATESVRHYPYGALAAHAIGYVAIVEPPDLPPPELTDRPLRTFRFRTLEGRAGLEQRFDANLQGTNGGEVWVVDPAGFQYQRLAAQPPQMGGSLATSLDIDIQAAADRGLANRAGAAIALDVRTGEVLAMASGPTYDLGQLVPRMSTETFARIEQQKGWLNRATQGLYPPGSTFKLVTAIAALQFDPTLADYRSQCLGFQMIGARRFHCNNRLGHGAVDIETSLEKSCNIWYYQIGLRLGPELVARTARDFGLDARTGIPLANSDHLSIVPDPEWRRSRGTPGWSGGDTANVSIGQGDLVQTPLQMACFAASLARGETRTVPTLQRLAPGLLPDHGGRPIALAPALLARLREGMERAAKTGTAKFIAIPGLRIAAKTGTAQIRVEGAPSTLAWTIAYAPAEAPRFAVAVVVESATGAEELAGGIDAAPIAREMLRTALALPGATRADQQ